MNSEMTSKNDRYKAAGYATLLMLAAMPLSFLGMQVLNFVLGNIKI